MKTGIIAAGIILATLVGTYFIMQISYSNQEIRLRETVMAKQNVCKTYYDKVWKILQQKAQVSDQYKTSFDTIYTNIMNSRYQNGGGELMKWIQESNPNFDISLYADLSKSIEAERTGYFIEQKGLIDLDREHKTMRKTFPASWFIGDRTDVGIVIILSDKTDAVYLSGQENDINLFKK